MLRASPHFRNDVQEAVDRLSFLSRHLETSLRLGAKTFPPSQARRLEGAAQILNESVQFSVFREAVFARFGCQNFKNARIEIRSLHDLGVLAHPASRGMRSDALQYIGEAIKIRARSDALPYIERPSKRSRARPKVRRACKALHRRTFKVTLNSSKLATSPFRPFSRCFLARPLR